MMRRAAVQLISKSCKSAEFPISRGCVRLFSSVVDPPTSDPNHTQILPNPLANEVKKSRRKKSMLYTRTGDKGTSSLYNLERRPKHDLIFHALGHQDELNAAIGIAREYCLIAGHDLDEKLIEIQSRLFDLGACVATPPKKSSEEKVEITRFSPKCTAQLESWIDDLDAAVPPLDKFVIPSGGITSTHLNMARAICRRAERSVIELATKETIDGEVARYLNRLSDFLFIASRYCVHREGRVEVVWQKIRD